MIFIDKYKNIKIIFLQSYYYNYFLFVKDCDKSVMYIWLCGEKILFKID